MYIKALEEEVLRLKEIYSSVAQDREKLADENRLLKEALVQNGITVPYRSPHDDSGAGNGSANHPGSNFGGQSAFSPGQASHSTASPGGQSQGYQGLTGNQLRTATEQSTQRGLDVEQAGIDFVLA